MKPLLILGVSLLVLTACKDFRQDPQEAHAIFKDKPNGQGDPAAISCYRPPSSTSRFSDLECRHNAEWAKLAAEDHGGGAVDLGNRAGGAAVSVTH